MLDCILVCNAAIRIVLAVRTIKTKISFRAIVQVYTLDLCGNNTLYISGY